MRQDNYRTAAAGTESGAKDAQRNDNRKQAGRRPASVVSGENRAAEVRSTGYKNSGAAGKNRAGKRSACPYSGQCGGCSNIDMPMEEQLRIKQAWVEQCVGEYGPVEPIVRMKNPMRYRNKVTSIFGLDRKRHPVCGVYKAHSREIVPVKNCLIENRQADRIIQDIFGMLGSFRLKVYDPATGTGTIRAVQIRMAHATRQILVTIVTAGPVFPSRNHFAEALAEAHPEITSIVQNIKDDDSSMILGSREKVLYGSGYITDELCGKRFRISSRSFYQINSLQAEKLYNIALDGAALSGRERVLDAYCGIGTIGICAADRAKEVISVELNPDAAADAEENVRLNGLKNVTVYNEDATGFLQELVAQKGFQSDAGSSRNGQSERVKHGDAPGIDVLLMDPPRSGATEEFLYAAMELRPEKIIYISCNPETLGRDLKILTQGYRMKKAAPVDLFPFTAECEVAAVLQRKR